VATANVKILLVDDHVVLRSGLRQVLAQRPDLVLAGEASSGSQALELVRELGPDLVLLDIHLPDIDGVEVSRRILRDHPSVKVVIFSSDTARELVDELLEIGVCGYLSKTSTVEELIAAIDSVMAGKLYLSTDVSGGILADYRKKLRNESGPQEPAVSDREKQLLKLVAEGRRNKEIGAELNVSVKSVEAYRARLMKKLGRSSSAELVRYAVRAGIAKL
jgi:DNA-binding NarL/FixJ family response regulator